MASSIVPPAMQNRRRHLDHFHTHLPAEQRSLSGDAITRRRGKLQKHSRKVTATTSSTTARGFQWARERAWPSAKLDRVKTALIARGGGGGGGAHQV